MSSTLKMSSSINFCRWYPPQGTILFHSNAQEALQKVREAEGGEDPKVKEQVVQWEVLEGDVEMEMLKKIIEDQQESMNKRRGSRGNSEDTINTRRCLNPQNRTV